MSISSAVWKFAVPLGEGDYIDVEMPAGAEVLTLQVQYGSPYVWARVNPEAPIERRRFRWAGTGHALGSLEGAYVGTVQIAGGQLVFHLFECPSANPQSN